MPASQPDNGPRDVRQASGVQPESCHTAATTPSSQSCRRGMSRVNEDQFVRAVHATGNKPPCVVLYDNRQMDDLKCFCSSENPPSILGIDPKFKLAKCFVTVTTFKYVDAIRKKTCQPPIFLGPCYLHWDTTAATYAYFLYDLRSKLSCNADADVCIPVDVVARSDDKKALHSALDLVFSNSNHLLCLQHLKRNVEQRLRRGEDKGGLERGKPSQPLKLALPPNTTDVAPPHMSYHRKFLPVMSFSHSCASAAISRTLALLNSAGTNFINYLLTCLLDTENGMYTVSQKKQDT